MKEYRTIFFSLLLIVLFCGCGSTEATVQNRDVYEIDASSIASLPPSRHLIPGVPFVSWSEAASLQYANKEVLNPSSVAATLMYLRFWLPGAGIEDTAILDGWMRISREKANLETLKKIVADDLPVQVPMALTPFAHPVTADSFLSGLNQLLPVDKGPYGGALGKLMPLPVLVDLAGDIPGILISQPTANTPAFIANKSSIGYLWPMMFITIACGANSGFHSLIASGTTSKQITNECHAKRVGFGGMLTEGFLATIVIVLIVGGFTLGEFNQHLIDKTSPVRLYGLGFGLLFGEEGG